MKPNNASDSRAGRAERGRWAEEVAAAFLHGRGLRTLNRNYRCRWGEIDLVMDDHKALVFVEVRYRGPTSLVSGADSVDERKQRKLISAAEHFLQANPRFAERRCRFDVVSIAAAPPGNSERRPRVDWIRDAFEAGY